MLTGVAWYSSIPSPLLRALGEDRRWSVSHWRPSNERMATMGRHRWRTSPHHILARKSIPGKWTSSTSEAKHRMSAVHPATRQSCSLWVAAIAYVSAWIRHWESAQHTRMPSSSIAASCPSGLSSPSRYLNSWLSVNNAVPSMNSSAQTQPALKTSIASVTFPSFSLDPNGLLEA